MIGCVCSRASEDEPGKQGEAGDPFGIVDAARRRQATPQGLLGGTDKR